MQKETHSDLRNIQSKIVMYSFTKFILEISNDLKLAVPGYNQSNPIEILIGVAHFYNLV